MRTRVLCSFLRPLLNQPASVGRADLAFILRRTEFGEVGNEDRCERGASDMDSANRSWPTSG